MDSRCKVVNKPDMREKALNQLNKNNKHQHNQLYTEIKNQRTNELKLKPQILQQYNNNLINNLDKFLNHNNNQC